MRISIINRVGTGIVASVMGLETDEITILIEPELIPGKPFDVVTLQNGQRHTVKVGEDTLSYTSA